MSNPIQLKFIENLANPELSSLFVFHHDHHLESFYLLFISLANIIKEKS